VRPQIHRALSAEEFARLADPEAKELVDGEILPMTPTFFIHGLVAGRLCGALRQYLAGTERGEVVTAEVGFITRRNPDRVRAPDVAFVEAKRLVGRDLEHGFFEGPPDLAIEVLSSDDRPAEVQAKVAEYLAAGAQAVWVADPSARTVTVHVTGRAAVVLSAGAVLEGGALLPGFALELARLFAR
jgi:Uma2 family endonuclease